LVRTVRGLAQILDELDAAGVAFRSVTEPFDTTTSRRPYAGPDARVIAAVERTTIHDWVIGGTGAEPCGGTHVLVPPAEAPLVPVIVDHYANGHKGAQANRSAKHFSARQALRRGAGTPRANYPAKA
jgi:site-specific DNA recombinase